MLLGLAEIREDLRIDSKEYTPSPRLQDKVMHITISIQSPTKLKLCISRHGYIIIKHEIPILMYHRFVKTEEEGGIHGTWITAQRFEEHLKWLKKNHYETVTFTDLHQNGLISRLHPNKRIVMLLDC